MTNNVNTNLGKSASSNVRTLDERFTLETGIDVSKKERGVNLEPKVGMGLTATIRTDSYPYTIKQILEVKGKTILVIQSDRDLYNYNPLASVEYVEQFKDEDGSIAYRSILWNDKTNRWNKNNYDYRFYSVGERNYYLDPSV